MIRSILLGVLLDISIGIVTAQRQIEQFVHLLTERGRQHRYPFYHRQSYVEITLWKRVSYPLAAYVLTKQGRKGEMFSGDNTMPPH